MAGNDLKTLEKQFSKIWRRSAAGVLSHLRGFDEKTWLSEALNILKPIAMDAPLLRETAPGLRLPLTGAINVMTLFKLLAEKNVSSEEIRSLSDKILKMEIERFPAIARRASTWFLFTDFAARITRHYADKSQTSDDKQFKLAYVDTGKNSFGMNITQCAICRLAGRHDMSAMMPYICSIDGMLSEMLGWGLKRTQTIAGGAKHCDFVFRKGASTELLA